MPAIPKKCNARNGRATQHMEARSSEHKVNVHCPQWQGMLYAQTIIAGVYVCRAAQPTD